jgi:hypothetical protein
MLTSAYFFGHLLEELSMVLMASTKPIKTIHNLSLPYIYI